MVKDPGPVPSAATDPEAREAYRLARINDTPPPPPFGTDNICPNPDCGGPIEAGDLPYHSHHGLSLIHNDCCQTYPNGCP